MIIEVYSRYNCSYVGTKDEHFLASTTSLHYICGLDIYLRRRCLNSCRFLVFATGNDLSRWSPSPTGWCSSFRFEPFSQSTNFLTSSAQSLLVGCWAALHFAADCLGHHLGAQRVSAFILRGPCVCPSCSLYCASCTCASSGSSLVRLRHR